MTKAKATADAREALRRETRKVFFDAAHKLDWRIPGTVRIMACRDPQMWYSRFVGQEVKVHAVDECGLWGREPAGYTNIIHFSDAIPTLAPQSPAEV